MVPGTAPGGGTLTVCPRRAAHATSLTETSRERPLTCIKRRRRGRGRCGRVMGEGTCPLPRVRGGTRKTLLRSLHSEDALGIGERHPFARPLKHQGPQISLEG